MADDSSPPPDDSSPPADDSSPPAENSSPPRTLELLYEEVIRESERLRSARGTFSRQLGPLPLAGALVLGVFTAFAKHPHRTLALVAVGLFGLSVVVSMLASGIAPYRRLRVRTIKKQAEKDSEWSSPELQGAMDTDAVMTPTGVLSEEAWLCKRIDLERRLYGAAPSRVPRLDLLRPGRWPTLQQALEIERYAVLLVQLLFLAEIVLLFAAGGQ